MDSSIRPPGDLTKATMHTSLL